MGTLSDWIDLGRMDELGRQSTPVHRIDARAKALVTLAFLVTVMSFPAREFSALLPFFMFPVSLVMTGNIPPGILLRKVVFAAPFAIVMGLFNPLLDREPVMAVGPFVLSGGWLSFGSIMLRFVLTVSTALALVAVTGLYRLGEGLNALGVPAVFVQQLFFLYRYLFVLADEGATMWRAARARLPASRTALSLATYGSFTGSLLMRATDRAERIHCAMRSRGFDGTIRTGPPMQIRAGDAVFVIAWLAFFIVARKWNLPHVFGTMFL